MLIRSRSHSPSRHSGYLPCVFSGVHEAGCELDIIPARDVSEDDRPQPLDDLPDATREIVEEAKTEATKGKKRR